ncbi:MAG: HEAT repeat domain-containing protein [Sandaracinaceae bacterium]|nr:HEAT repeat domain-containing protein [Sandaracinaceae bacterium]
MKRLLIATALALAAASPASAQDFDEAVAQLEGTNPDAVRGGLEQLGLLGNARAVDPIAARVRRGLPPELLGVAVDTLMILGRPQAGPVLVELLGHRRPDIRLKAVQAIVACQPRGADRVLTEALGDTDATVRGAAAEGLGTLGAHGAVDALFHAMERRVPEAAPAIAAVADPRDVDRFLGLLGRVPFAEVTTALGEMLHRANLAASAKLAIIHRLSELATPEVRQFLEELVANADASIPANVLRAAQDAIPRIAQ